MSRIAISEDDLNASDPNAPAVYGPVGGAPHPNVYGPVAPPPAPRQHSEVAVATWVLAAGALALCITFGVGGFFAGRSGRLSESERQAERATERTQFDGDRRQAVREATASTRDRERARADDLVAKARRGAYDRGRAAGLRDGREQGRQEGRRDIQSFTGECLTGLGC